MAEMRIDGVEVDETFFYDFRIFQKKEGWRFSVDSVILSSFFAEIETKYFRNETRNYILDVGTGCGIVSILSFKFLKDKMNEENPTFIGVDIDIISSKIAKLNFERNGFDFKVVAGDIRRHPFKKGAFDVIVSNPPYLPVGEGKISPKYDIAKWEITFDLKSFAKASYELLKNKGRIYVAYTSSRLGEVLSVFFKTGLNPSFIKFFHHSQSNSSDFFVLSAQKGGRRKLEVLPPIFEKSI